MSVAGVIFLRSAPSLFARRMLCFGLNGGGPLSGVQSSSKAPLGRPACSRSIWSSLGGPVNWATLQNDQPYRRLHTAGDHELADFLKHEIKHEKDVQKQSGKLPMIKNFEVTKCDGPNVVLTRKLDNETITVKFSVNNTVEDSDFGMEGDQDEGQSLQMSSRPPFVVEINKGGEKTLAIHCVFPHPVMAPPPMEQDQDQESDQDKDQGQEQHEETIDIQDVALLNKSQEWTDDVYSLSGSAMDGNLYDKLLKLLGERGVDEDFIKEIIDFSTSYEHNNYIDLLEQLKGFVESK